MQCPVCSNVSLTMTERQGVEIDYCPNCRGVWLDRGELDKILERSQNASPRMRGADAQRSDPTHRTHESSEYPRRKKSWLEDIFD